MPTYATFTQHSTERPSYRNQIRKEIKEIQFGKKEIKLSLFRDDIVLYTENPKNATRKLLELTNEFGKVAE